MLICSAHYEVIDRTHRQCETAERLHDWDGCLMAGRGGTPFSDLELHWHGVLESWRTRLLEDSTPLTREDRTAIADLLVMAWRDALAAGPIEDESPSA